MTLEKIILSGLLGLMLSCGSAEETGSKTGCTSNSECKGGRVCYQSKCVEQGEVPDGGVIGSDGGTVGDDYPEGKIVFVSVHDYWDDFGNGADISMINPDGTGLVNILEDNNYLPRSPLRWSPDKKNILYGSVDGIYIIDADGSNRRIISDSGIYPTWSPDGTKIAFVADKDIYTMNLDGTNRRNLTNSENISEFHPDWSPDGTKIAFVAEKELYVMNADGSGAYLLSDSTYGDALPRWSPDGTKIAFCRVGEDEELGINYDLYIHTINSDGSGLMKISERNALFPSWSPDGKRLVVIGVNSPVDVDLYILNADGSGEWKNLTNKPERGDIFPDWSR